MSGSSGEYHRVRCVRAAQWHEPKAGGDQFVVVNGVKEFGKKKVAGVDVPNEVWVSMLGFGAAETAMLELLVPGQYYDVSGRWQSRDYRGKTELRCVVSDVREVVAGGDQLQQAEPRRLSQVG